MKLIDKIQFLVHIPFLEGMTIFRVGNEEFFYTDNKAEDRVYVLRGVKGEMPLTVSKEIKVCFDLFRKVSEVNGRVLYERVYDKRECKT